MNLLAVFGTKKSADQLHRAKDAIASVREARENLERAADRLGDAVRSNILETTLNRTLAENRRVTGRPRRNDQDH